MSIHDDIEEMCNKIILNIHKSAEMLGNKVLTELNKETSKAMDDAMREFGIYQQEMIRRMFNEAVDTFYSSYTPKVYTRIGDPDSHDGGLYDVLSIKTDNDGTVILNRDSGYMNLIDKTKMHNGRRSKRKGLTYDGTSLFEKVFMSGWHGGAEDGEYLGEEHPFPGTPYYRTPVGPYYAWGYEAIQTESPHSMFVDSIDNSLNMENGEMFLMFREISQKHNNIAVNKVKNNIPKYYADIKNEIRRQGGAM